MTMADNSNDALSKGSDDSLCNDPSTEFISDKCAAEIYYFSENNSFKILFVVCHSLCDNKNIPIFDESKQQ